LPIVDGQKYLPRAPASATRPYECRRIGQNSGETTGRSHAENDLCYLVKGLKGRFRAERAGSVLALVSGKLCVLAPLRESLFHKRLASRKVAKAPRRPEQATLEKSARSKIKTQPYCLFGAINSNPNTYSEFRNALFYGEVEGDGEMDTDGEGEAEVEGSGEADGVGDGVGVGGGVGVGVGTVKSFHAKSWPL